MDVKQLRKLLKGIDGKKVVIMAKDAEGNNFCPLREIDEECNYSTYSGEIGLAELTPDLRQQGYTNEDVLEGQPALILWPVN